MKTPLLLLVFAAVLQAQNAPVDAKTASVAASTPADPSPLTPDKQIALLLALSDAQSAIIQQNDKLSHNQLGNDDVKAVSTATSKYTTLLAEAKKEAGAIDSSTAVWVWNYITKKWIAQPIGRE